jgi:hypothetical protein
VSTEVDHLVVAASTLDEGVRWCEATLGMTPAAGGRHETMGTHNRLVRLSSAAFPRSYLEIIAIDPDAPPPQRLRWYALDDLELQASLRKSGPRLINVVVRTQMLETHRWGLQNKGLNPGVPLALHRDSPKGRLSWHIVVRDDGRLLVGGVVPSLLQWDSPSAADALPDQGAALQSLRLDGLPAAARDVLRLQGVAIDCDASPRITAVVETPHGAVTLQS